MGILKRRWKEVLILPLRDIVVVVRSDWCERDRWAEKRGGTRRRFAKFCICQCEDPVSRMSALRCCNPVRRVPCTRYYSTKNIHGTSSSTCWYTSRECKHAHDFGAYKYSTNYHTMCDVRINTYYQVHSYYSTHYTSYQCILSDKGVRQHMIHSTNSCQLSNVHIAHFVRMVCREESESRISRFELEQLYQWTFS